MRYKLASADADRLTLAFSMPERGLIIGFLAVAAAVCLLMGLAYAVSDDPGDGLRALCFSGFGLFCLSAIFLFVTQFTPPRRLVFDNAAGRLLVHDRKDQAGEEVPYTGIRGFSVYPSFSQRVLSHSVGIDLARGGRIELYAPRSEAKATSFRDTLAKGVTLSSAAQRAAANGPDQPRPGVLELAWSRKTRPLSLVVSLLVLLSFVGALVDSRPFASGPGAWVAALAFGAFFLLAAVIGVLRTLGEHMSLRVDERTFQFSRRSSLSRGATISLPLSQIAAVDFSMILSRVATRITLLRAEDVEKFTSWRQGTFRPTETVDMFRFLRQLPQVDVSALPASQRFSLAEAIRERLLPGAS
jgi:hypothetical protein